MPVAGRGEVALLAQSFNGMADALGAREEELRVAGDRLQGILEHATALISVKDVDGRYLARRPPLGGGHRPHAPRRSSGAPTPS